MQRTIPHINSVVRYFWQRAWHHRSYITVITLVMPLNVLMNQIVPPIILAQVLNRLAKGDFVPHALWQSFGWELIAYAALVVVGGLSWRIIDVCQWRLEGGVQKEMADEVFSHLMSQSSRFHADNFTGSLVSNANKLLSSYVRFADTTTFSILPLAFGLLFSLIVLLRVAPLYAVILLAFAVTYMVSAVFITKRVRAFGAQHSTVESRQTGVLADAITNVMAIKSFAAQTREERRFAAATEETRLSLLAFGRAHQKQQLYFGTLLSGIDAAALLMAVVAVMAFGANAATVFLIFNYTAVIAEQLFSFSNNAMRNYNRSLADAKDMVDMLHTVPEILDPEDPEKVAIRRGVIDFKNVTFKHNGNHEALFNGLNLHVKQGEKVGLVGYSGSGKTTLSRLLLRFSDIQSGEICIDGQNIAHIKQDDLRRHIAYVPQEPLLFHRTIAENIAYGATGADAKAIEGAAQMASADEFVRDLPNGYATLVGERGVKLSGGQRQRVAIARAMLKNAPILVLDEATSALDSESEALIQRALWQLMEGRTAIVIAHRLSTVQKMDRIVVLDNGKIVEEGSHKELLSNPNGTYAKLWARQSGGFIED